MQALLGYLALLSLASLSLASPLRSEARSAAAVVDASSAETQLTASGSCCKTLNHFLPSQVFDPYELEWTVSKLSYWAKQEQEINPSCIVRPKSTEDAQAAIIILNAGYALNISGCDFAIRSGGHSPNAGFANQASGVTIDLQKLNQVTLSSDGSTVTLGPGNRWGNVYTTLDPQGVTVAGGRVSTVGAGGLLTGGGVSFFSGTEGLSCDNIESFEAILANGTVVQTSNTAYPDLHRALKGSSNNLALITALTMKAIPLNSTAANKFWGGNIISLINEKSSLLSFLVNYTSSPTADPHAALINNFAWTAGIWTADTTVQYTLPTTDPAVFQPLLAIPKLVDTLRLDTHGGFATELAGFAVLASTFARAMFSTVTVRASVGATFLEDVWELADQMITKSLKNVAGFRLTMSFQPFPRRFWAGGDNILGLEDEEEDCINILIGPYWESAGDDEKVSAAVEGVIEEVQMRATEIGGLARYIYLNYAARWQDPITTYGSENVEELKRVSGVYDPDGLFQKKVPGGFKLGV